MAESSAAGSTWKGCRATPPPRARAGRHYWVVALAGTIRRNRSTVTVLAGTCRPRVRASAVVSAYPLETSVRVSLASLTRGAVPSFDLRDRESSAWPRSPAGPCARRTRSGLSSSAFRYSVAASALRPARCNACPRYNGERGQVRRQPHGLLGLAQCFVVLAFRIGQHRPVHVQEAVVRGSGRRTTVGAALRSRRGLA
jgi:hypothetical protein